MQRRDGSGQPVKGRRAPKARKAPNADLSVASLQEQLDRRTRERDEALEQQTATSKVLGVTRSSPTDVQPVFETIANNSVNLCGATYCIVYSFDGEMVSVVAHHNLDRVALDALRQIWPMAPDARALVGRTILERDVLQVVTLPPSRITLSPTAAKQSSAFGRFSASRCCVKGSQLARSASIVARLSRSPTDRSSSSRRSPTRR